MEGKKSLYEMEGLPLIEKGVILSVPRLYYARSPSLSLPFALSLLF